MADAKQMIAALLVRLPSGVFSLAYIGKRIRKEGITLDAKAQFICRLVDKTVRPVSQETVEGARAQIEGLARLLGSKGPKVKEVRDLRIRGGAGEIPARLYRPVEGANLPLLVYFHGGGYIRGSLDSHDAACRHLAHAGEALVLSVAYRLAPEDKFPAAPDDALAAYRWARENAAELGADASRIAVGGDSSGGNLAAVVCQDAHKAALPLPAFQLLIYPVTDIAFDTPSHATFGEGFLLRRDRMNWYRDLYLDRDADWEDVRISPAKAKDLAGLPPALVITAGFDPLRDEGEAYARRLSEAGVPVGMVRYDGMLHGFINMDAAFPEAAEALRQSGIALKAAMAR